MSRTPRSSASWSACSSPSRWWPWSPPIPLLWGWGLGWHDVVIALVFYWVSGLGMTVGYHRYFTHGSFKAKTGLRVALAIAGSLAIEGPVITWVSDHRRHHKYSDQEGDPHSPWRYGDDWKALTKGLVYAHIGWLFDPNKTSQEKFSPDLLADRRIQRVDRCSPRWWRSRCCCPR